MKPPKTFTELINRAYDIIGVPLRLIDNNERLLSGKGGIGQMIEESWFGQKPHNDPSPDFKNLGVELKVTPFVIRKNKTYRSKERLVGNMINYMEEYKNDKFETSSFYLKNNTVLLMFYEHILDKSKGDYNISYVKLVTMSEAKKHINNNVFLIPEEDIEIMRQDYEKIITKIRMGKAHEISEGDTNYLGACTKSADSSIRVDQPFSDIKAKPRAFALKQSYMSYILNNYVITPCELEQLISNKNELKKKNFEDIVISKFEQYYGKTDVELANLFEINSKNKGFRSNIISAILGIEGNANETEEFQKAGILAKTIRVEESGRIKESMSFPSINFLDLVKESWEESKIYEQIGLSKFMFVIFVKSGHDYIFKKVVFWNISEKDLDEVQKVWQRTKTIVGDNKIQLGGKYGFSVLNFPKSKENRVAHVRPHDQNAKIGRSLLPNGDKIMNYCFWLNRDYIMEIIQTFLNT